MFVGVMLSIARSRLSPPIQILFLVLNGFAVLLAIIHNSITPDLYANSAHRPIGWILTWIVGAQVAMAVFIRACGRKNNATDTGNPNEQLAFIPVSAEAIEEHERIHLTEQNYRFSNDSGHGTERNTESLRSHSISSIDGLEADRVSSMGKYGNETVDGEKRTLRLVSALYKLISLPASPSSRTLQAVILVQEIINRLILVLGFIALTTGIVTYFGIFVCIFHSHLVTKLLISNSEDMRSSRGLLISSRVGYSSGMEFSLLAAGQGVLQVSAGYGFFTLF
jgi:hypothetical protein